MFAKAVDCQSRLSINLFLIAARHGGRELYASRERRLGVSGVDGDLDNGPAYGGHFVSLDNPMLLLFSLSAIGTFIAPFPLTAAKETLERDISYFFRYLQNQS